MAPTRMKLRVRRRDGAAGGSQPAEEEERSREGGGRSGRRKNTDNASTSAAAAAASPPSPPSTSSTASARAAEETSPDSKCPICLDRFNNLAYLDCCLHRFCFPCIQEWSKNKEECPLCKQRFTAILHSLRPMPANCSVPAIEAMRVKIMSASRDTLWMLSLMFGRNSTAEESLIRRTWTEEGGGGGGDRGAGARDTYFDSQTLPLAYLPHQPAGPEDRGDRDEQTNWGRPDLERGVLFEGIAIDCRTDRKHNDRASRRLMTRLVARRRLQREGGIVRRLRDRETVAFRCGLYRFRIRVHGVAGVSDNQGQQCDISAESFRRNPAHLNRLRPWLRRELTVLYGTHNSLVSIVHRIIMAQLAHHGLDDWPTIERALRPFLLACTDHFLHELVSFARSPLTLENYDLQAVYEPPAAAMELDGTSSLSDSSSVIAISEGEEEEGHTGGSSEERRVGGAHDDVIQTGSNLSLSAWDDETPGPSFSTAEPSSNSAHSEAANKEEGVKPEEEECMIIGYKKPIAERTPELVQLSSDTEEDDTSKGKGSAVKTPTVPSPLCPAAPFFFIPTIPLCTSTLCQNDQDKSGEAAACRSRARSWSVSSERSRESECSLSPSERRAGRKRSRMENRRRRRRRRKRKRQDESGTFHNPNRSIYPVITSSPFHSSIESRSPLLPSPPDSSWASPVSSSLSHYSSSSSSLPHCLSPQLSSSPTPSLSPRDTHNSEKPSGKRKYKSRHLDNNDKDPTWRPSGGQQGERRRERDRKRKTRTRDGSSSRRRRRRRRRESGGGRGESRKRSPSVEIIYERSVTCDAEQPPRKRRSKGHREAQRSSSPLIITLDSDSSHNDVNNKTLSGGSSSSSPLSSQQTVDFSDLPLLPLVHSAGMGGALDEDIGELPINILDRGSDGVEAELRGQSDTAGPITVESIDNSDHDVDVENDDEGLPPSISRPIRTTEQGAAPAEKTSNQGESTSLDACSERKGGNDSSATHLLNSAVSPYDRNLLATVLDDLKGIVAPKCDFSLNFVSRRSPNTRKKDFPNVCEVSGPHSKQEANMSKDEELKDQNQDSDFPTSLGSAPLLSFPRLCIDIPPLLKRASPVRSFNRNTPPPLKHKDAGSPRLSPVTPLFSGDDPVGANSSLDVTSNPSPSYTDPCFSKDSDGTPPGSLALRGVSASTSSSHTSRPSAAVDDSAVPSNISVLTTKNHKPQVDSTLCSGSEDTSASADCLPRLDLPNSFPSSTLHSSCDGTPSSRQIF